MNAPQQTKVVRIWLVLGTTKDEVTAVLLSLAHLTLMCYILLKIIDTGGAAVTEMENLLILQVAMLVLLFSGYVLRKRNVMSGIFRKALTDFIINFILPCNIIKSFLMEFDGRILRDCMAILLVSCGTQVFSLLMAWALYSRTEDGKRQPLLYATQVSNAGFLGSPIS